MAVLIEALNIIVNDEAFKKNPIKRKIFLSSIPTRSFCGDGSIYRLGFMDPKYIEEYCDFLIGELGLIFIDNSNKAIDFVVIDMLKGPTTECDWIRFKRDKLFKHRINYNKSDEEFSIAWKLDNFEGDPNNYLYYISEQSSKSQDFLERGIVFPIGWTPDKAIYTSNFSNNPKEDLEEISRDNRIITYKRKSTGELVYVGIPQMKSDNHISAKPQNKTNGKYGLWSRIKSILKK